MNRIQKQIILFATRVKMPSNVYKRERYQAALDNIFVKLIVAPLQKAFREKYPPYDTKRQFCPNPRDSHFEYGKTPYLRDGYCPICDDTCFCFYCGKLLVGTADWEFYNSDTKNLCSICFREEQIEDAKHYRSMYGGLLR